MIAALRTAGGTPRYTEMHAYGHLIMCWVIRHNPHLLRWLFSQRRAGPSLASHTTH